MKLNLHGNMRSKILYQSKCTLKSHFDSIRGLTFLSTTNPDGSMGHSLVSASEDCSLKLWDANKFCNYKELQAADGHSNFEPYLTLRGHRTPIFSIDGRDSMQISGNLDGVVVSGSQNGQIKAWTIPASSKFVDTYGPNKEQSFCIATYDSAHGSQPVWDVRIHPYENIFLSIGADNSIGLWQIPLIPDRASLDDLLASHDFTHQQS
jgi:WD40 repeat protein